jgi:hypothetical protein
MARVRWAVELTNAQQQLYRYSHAVNIHLAVTELEQHWYAHRISHPDDANHSECDIFTDWHKLQHSKPYRNGIYNPNSFTHVIWNPIVFCERFVRELNNDKQSKREQHRIPNWHCIAHRIHDAHVVAHRNELPLGHHDANHIADPVGHGNGLL